jgi:DNA-binding HxlR family transcriptional regulator
MPEPALFIPKDSYEAIQNHIETTIKSGSNIRDILGNHSNRGLWDTTWEVQAAVEALHVFGSRWTIEILSTLYIAGPRRFNQMKGMLTGISSRTLSDKLRFLVEEGLVVREVEDGPPIRVSYILSEHGRTCGRLLSPLVAHLKIRNNSVLSNN